MKFCPLCSGTYTDEDFNYCSVDGAILLNILQADSSTFSPANFFLEDVILPPMGDNVSKAKIIKWLRNVGDTVKCDEPLYEISTSKVDAEIPSSCSGVLFEIKVPEGQVVPAGTVIARIRRSENPE